MKNGIAILGVWTRASRIFALFNFRFCHPCMQNICLLWKASVWNTGKVTRYRFLNLFYMAHIRTHKKSDHFQAMKPAKCCTCGLKTEKLQCITYVSCEIHEFPDWAQILSFINFSKLCRKFSISARAGKVALILPFIARKQLQRTEHGRFLPEVGINVPRYRKLRYLNYITKSFSLCQTCFLEEITFTSIINF